MSVNQTLKVLGDLWGMTLSIKLTCIDLMVLEGQPYLRISTWPVGRILHQIFCLKYICLPWPPIGSCVFIVIDALRFISYCTIEAAHRFLQIVIGG